jgi:hypothetical protein
MENLLITVPIIVGALIGVLEAMFVYGDENMTNGKQFIGDMVHGLIFCIGGTFVACNIPFIIGLGFIPSFLEEWLFIDSAGNSMVISVIIMIIMKVKMVASHAIKGVSTGGFKEKFWHILLVSSLVGFSGYYIQAIVPFLPEWLLFF